LASAIADECRIVTGKPPESRSQIDQLIQSRFEQDRLVAKQFFNKYGESAFVYKTDGKRCWMYVNKAFNYHGVSSYLCATSEAGVHWVSAVDLVELDIKLSNPDQSVVPK
jgi:hypothetical protein